MVALPAVILEAALASAELAQKYDNSKHVIELLGKDEESRRLHAEIIILEQDAVELHDQLQHEQETSDHFRELVEQHLLRAQDAEITLTSVQRDLQSQRHESARLQQELDSVRATSQGTSDLLAEKFSLAHELSLLRPEVQHLRTSAASVEGLVGEKLALQRQLADMQCELASAKADAKRAQAKRRNTTMEIAQEEQVEGLKKQLAKEKRARKSAEESATQAQSDMKADDVKRELASEKQRREKLEEEIEAMKENTQVDEMRRELFKAQRNAKRAQDQVDMLRSEVESLSNAATTTTRDNDNDAATALQQDVAQLKAQQTSSQAETARREEQWEKEKATLEDKLSQFRIKLRETKDLLKATKEELAAVTERAEKADSDAQVAAMEAAVLQVPAPRTAKKRTAKIVDAVSEETALGTPGDGPPAKRARKTNAAIGSKSAFSITPFLNKTTVIDEDRMPDSEAEISPTKPRARVPLAEVESIRRNSVLSPGKIQAEAQEETATKESVPPSTASLKIEQPPSTDQPEQAKQKAAKKKRKSLVDFETFKQTADQPAVKQKKRKLGGPGPTLFDEDDDNGLTSTSKTSFGKRSLLRATPGSRLASAKKGASRVGLLTANDGSGFQFSPLRRKRTNIDDTMKL